ncbi:MAG: hypothetical protein O3B95_13360 [Chloroflexi bacterium]|nr:hypothetical protein [Chloroflexota bacterium]
MEDRNNTWYLLTSDDAPSDDSVLLFHHRMPCTQAELVGQSNSELSIEHVSPFTHEPLVRNGEYLEYDAGHELYPIVDGQSSFLLILFTMKLSQRLNQLERCPSVDDSWYLLSNVLVSGQRVQKNYRNYWQEG